MSLNEKNIAPFSEGLQEIRTSKANYDFDINSDFWQIDSNSRVSFKSLKLLNLEDSFLRNLKLVLSNYACEFSSGYILRLVNDLRVFFKEVNVKNKIDEKHIINFRSTLEKDTEYKLGGLRAFLLDWYEEGIKGVDVKAVELLASIKLSGNVKGKSVATRCPFSGAYTLEEQAAFISWYLNAFSENLISFEDYAIIMILQHTGIRPIQISMLYIEDIVLNETEDGGEQFDLHVPNAKKKSEFRGVMSTLTDISEDLAIVLMHQAQKSLDIVESYFDFKLSFEEKKKIPLFINLDTLYSLSDFTDFKNIQKERPDSLCIRIRGVSDSIIERIKKIAKLCPLKTQRIILDGEFGDLHISARRFRYTHATNLAMHGASDYVIAEAMTHEDTQNVKVYTEFNEEMAERIDEALKPSLTPLAQAFSGTLIDSEKDAIRANDPRSRIHIRNADEVGNCGTFGFCGLGSIHCYTCNKFQPWLNANHEAVLEEVMAQRDHRRDLGASEFVLQGANRTIDAIKVVIDKCKERREELANEGVING